MFRKLKTGTLLLILIVLSILFGISLLFDKKKGARTFREELVNIDTSLVNTILIYPQSENHKEIKLSRNGKSWSAQRENISSQADTSNIRNILGMFALIKPQRLAATEKSKWKDYRVDDSLSTRIKLMSGNDIVLDMVVGKFSYNNMTRQGISYVRLYEEDKVYAVDGFIPMIVNQPFNQWRNKTIFKGEKTNFTRITLNYPADSGYVLTKQNNEWKLDTAAADSNKVEQYLNSIAMLSSSSFADNYTANTAPVMSLTVEGANMSAPVVIKAFPSDSTHRYVIHSSFYPAAYFYANEADLDKTIFKSRAFYVRAVSLLRDTASR